MFVRKFSAALLLGGMLWAISVAAGPLPENGDGDYLVHVWQTDNGLPQNWVSSITQTPEGYLWIGMRYGGLARFDGVRFVPFNQQNTSELKDIQVEHLDVDETGGLWVIMGNESITAFRNGKFELFRHPRANPRLRANRILGVRTNQALFAGDSSYLVHFNIPAGTNGWKLLDPRPAIEPDAAAYLKDADDTIWFITQRRRLARFVNERFEFVPEAAGLPQPAGGSPRRRSS
ncbi:MAG: two-component regulator propeller domain-containing protein [Verrucomicrobiota bacterium]